MNSSPGLTHLPTGVCHESEDTEPEWLAQGHRRSMMAVVKNTQFDGCEFISTSVWLHNVKIIYFFVTQIPHELQVGKL